VQVGSADVRVIQDGFAVRERINVVGHDKTSMHSLDMEAESHIIKAGRLRFPELFTCW
jgi:hypothetical protein